MIEGPSPRLVEFIHRHCPTMDHIEALLALRDTREGRDVATIATERGMTISAVQRALDALASSGAVVNNNGSYLLNDEVTPQDLLGELGVLFNTRPVALVRAIYSRPSPIQSFADAFRLRKEEDS